MRQLLLMPPLLLDGVLLALFASGLLPGRTPILTNLARQAHDHELDARTTAYTRKLTAIWALCAGLLACVIAAGLLRPALFPAAMLVAACQGPAYLLLLMVEHVVRRRCLDHLEHLSFAEFLRFLRRVDYIAALRN